MLTAKNNAGDTPLHEAAKKAVTSDMQTAELLKNIFDTLSAEDKLKALNMKDGNGNTPLELVESKKANHSLQSLHKIETLAKIEQHLAGGYEVKAEQRSSVNPKEFKSITISSKRNDTGLQEKIQIPENDVDNFVKQFVGAAKNKKGSITVDATTYTLTFNDEGKINRIVKNKVQVGDGGGAAAGGGGEDAALVEEEGKGGGAGPALGEVAGEGGGGGKEGKGEEVKVVEEVLYGLVNKVVQGAAANAGQGGAAAGGGAGGTATALGGGKEGKGEVQPLDANPAQAVDAAGGEGEEEAGDLEAAQAQAANADLDAAANADLDADQQAVAKNEGGEVALGAGEAHQAAKDSGEGEGGAHEAGQHDGEGEGEKKVNQPSGLRRVAKAVIGF